MGINAKQLQLFGHPVGAERQSKGDKEERIDEQRSARSSSGPVRGGSRAQRVRLPRNLASVIFWPRIFGSIFVTQKDKT